MLNIMSPANISPVSQLEQAIKTEVAYMTYDAKYAHEKPYTMNYDTENVFPQTNTSNEPKPILVHNFRHLQNPQSFEQYGFSVGKLRSALNAKDYEDAAAVERIFYPEAIRFLGNMFPEAAKIEVLEHQACDTRSWRASR